jgi:hypothetical protein
MGGLGLLKSAARPGASIPRVECLRVDMAVPNSPELVRIQTTIGHAASQKNCALRSSECSGGRSRNHLLISRLKVRFLHGSPFRARSSGAAAGAAPGILSEFCPSPRSGTGPREDPTRRADSRADEPAPPGSRPHNHSAPDGRHGLRDQFSAAPSPAWRAAAFVRPPAPGSAGSTAGATTPTRWWRNGQRSSRAGL